jgi:hypothetical protein
LEGCEETARTASDRLEGCRTDIKVKVLLWNIASTIGTFNHVRDAVLVSAGGLGPEDAGLDKREATVNCQVVAQPGAPRVRRDSMVPSQSTDWRATDHEDDNAFGMSTAASFI